MKSLYPSEDGEALSQIDFPGLNAVNAHNSEGLLESGSPRWFALYTTCRHEKRVAQHLVQREIEHFLPLYVAHRKWTDGSKVALQLPLFPCYLFVRIVRSARAQVLSVPGALAIVGGTGKGPASLPDSAIDALRLGVEQSRVEPHPLVTAGCRVRISAGPFAGMTGIVARKKGGFRVVLTLEQIMQSVAIEVSEQDVEPVRPDLGAPELELQFA
jgi:transcription antitermination factor NusG